VQTFKHNDMADLRQILQSIAEDDLRLRRDATQQRRFIVTEGLFRATGAICALPEILELKEKYFYRLILDESLSFGSVGATGRGVTEHYGVDMASVEIVLVSMDTSLASVGGICVGSREIVDHQRLSGAGYCFSAAGPPFLSASATEALRIMSTQPELLQRLQSNAATLGTALSEGSLAGLLEVRDKEARSRVPTPVVHLVLAPGTLDFLSQEQRGDAEHYIVMDIASRCLALGTGVSACKFGLTKSDKVLSVRPSLRVCASATLTREQIDTTVANITAACMSALDQLKRSISDSGSSGAGGGAGGSAGSSSGKSPASPGSPTSFLGYLGLSAN